MVSLWGSNATWGNRTSSTNKHAAIYWANSVDPTALNQGVMLEYCYFSAETQFNARHASSRAHGFAIRCQKDEKGRWRRHYCLDSQIIKKGMPDSVI